MTAIETLVRSHLELVSTDLPAWLGLLDDEIVIEFPYGTSAGLAPRLQGKTAVAEAITTFLTQVPGVKFTNPKVFPSADDDEAFATYDLDITVARNGRTYRQRYVARFRQRRGKLVHFCEWFDPTRMLNAFGCARDDDRIEIIRTVFEKIDNRDPTFVNYYTDDVQFYFPRYGLHHGKSAILTFAGLLDEHLESLKHDIDGFTYVVSGNLIAVEGRESGVTRDGVRWPDGTISQGRFCNMYEFDGSLIRRQHIYVDPDYTNSDRDRTAMLREMKKYHVQPSTQAVT